MHRVNYIVDGLFFRMLAKVLDLRNNPVNLSQVSQSCICDLDFYSAQDVPSQTKYAQGALGVDVFITFLTGEAVPEEHGPEKVS